MNRERLNEYLERHKLDAIIATSPENIRYATGYTPFQSVYNRFAKAALVPFGDARPVIMVSGAEAGSFLDAGMIETADAIFFGANNLTLDVPEDSLNDNESWLLKSARSAKGSAVQALLAALAGMAGRKARIAVDRTGAPEVYSALAESGGDFEFVDRGEDLWRMVRMVKTAGEIEKLRRAAVVNEIALESVHLKLGRVDEFALAETYRATVTAAGGNFQHWWGTGGRASGAWRSPQPVIMQRGERFRYDAGLELEGYCSDLGGTANVGSNSKSEQAAYDAITAGIDEGIAQARVGVRVSELYEAVLRAIRNNGLPNYKHGMVGHGIGIEPRDYPILAPPMQAKSPFWSAPFDPPLEAGMVLNIETPLSGLGVGGYQHEVTLVVGQNGGRLLSPRRKYVVVEID